VRDLLKEAACGPLHQKQSLARSPVAPNFQGDFDSPARFCTNASHFLCSAMQPIPPGLDLTGGWHDA
jgi:hypothetical protein